MHQKIIFQEKVLIDVLNSCFLLNQIHSNTLNEDIQEHFQTRFLIKQD